MRRIVLMLLCAVAAQVGVASEWSFSGTLGEGFNAKTPLKVHQAGYDDMEITADYDTEGFKLPPHYTLRVEYGNDRAAWEFCFIHHKLYLQNTSSEISHFEITHGFSILTAGRAWQVSPVRVRVGGGIVIANSESTIRGKSHELHDAAWGEGYTLTGPALMAGVEKSVPMFSGVDLLVEGAVTYGRAKVPIGGGTAVATNLAGHLSAGIRVHP